MQNVVLTLKLVTESLMKPRLTLVAGLLSGILATFSTTTLVHAAAPTGAYEGNAYGTFSNLTAGPIAAVLGYSALIACPCQGTDGETLSNRVDSLSTGTGGNVLRADTVLSTVFTTASEPDGTASVRDTSQIQGLNAFNGLITADAVFAVANTTANATTIQSNATESTFVNLRIAGNPISANVAPNTKVALPGIGNVVLNKVISSGNGTSRGAIVVEMITVNVTIANSFGLPVGTRIFVGHAKSGFTRLPPGAAVVAGHAWAASSNQAIGDSIRNRIGLTARVGMGCRGTNGRTITNDIADVSVSPALSLGTGTTTAFGGPIAGGADAKTTATVQNVALLNGLITAATVKAVAETKIVNGVRTRSTTGSGFVSLVVLGIPLPLVVAPNTKISLPGIGFVVLNEQFIPPASSTGATRVNGIHIFVTKANVLGLPVGAEVIVAHADARAQAL